MSNPNRMRLAEALVQAKAMGGQPGEPGLETPIEARLLQNMGHVATGYFAPQAAYALAGKALPVMQGLGEAGAIFPEGAAYPIGNPAALKEMREILPESQQLYRQNEMLHNWHSQNMDWPRVMQDKWALLKHAAGS